MNVNVFVRKVRGSFKAVKEDMHIVKVKMESQEKIIRQMQQNQKVLLERIEKLEELADVPAPVQKFVGNMQSMKLHSDKCAYAKSTPVQNQAVFTSKEVAFEKGFSACACVMA